MARSTAQRVVAREPHRSHTRDFLKCIATVEMHEGWREEQTLSHWLSFSARALLGASLTAARMHDAHAENEAEYMKLVGLCRHPKETMRAMAEAYAIIANALETEPADVLTPIFSEIASASSLGQFFTPYELSLSTARLLLSDARETLERARAEGRRFITMMEPACGVGGMMLAANQVLREQGLDPARHAHWVGIDVDWRAVCGAYIQLSLTGASAIIQHGNALSGEVHQSLPTIMAVLFPKRERAPMQVDSKDHPVTAANPLATVQTAFDFMVDAA